MAKKINEWVVGSAMDVASAVMLKPDYRKLDKELDKMEEAKAPCKEQLIVVLRAVMAVVDPPKSESEG